MIDFNPSKLTFENVDRFFIKKSIYGYMMSKSQLLKGKLLDVGCGEMPYRNTFLENFAIKSYIGLDIFGALEYKTNVKPDYFWDGTTMPFEDDFFDSGFATEVLEHCPDPNITLLEIYRVLKPNSPLLLTIPFLWPTHESPYDFYRYTPFALKSILEKAGFEEIEIEGLGGWHASFAQMIGLWLRRSGISISRQKFLYFFIGPLMKYLIKIDYKPTVFSDQKMWTGFGIAAWKK